MRIPTDWDKYNGGSNSFFLKYFFLERVVKAYFDLLKNIEFDKPIDILEFGCGSGYIDRWLCKRYRVNKVTLIDSNKRMLSIAKQTLADISCKKELINKDFFSYETDEKYDIVHSQGVIEHFEPRNRFKLLAKHFSSTKPGGYCIVYSPTPTKFYLFFRKLGELLGVWRFPDEVPLEKIKLLKR